MERSKVWTAEKPSNIALIKYMGKKDVEKNIPTNTSISWTLDHLKTTVTIEKCSGEDQWQALPSDFPFEMSDKGREKYLAHLKRVKDYFGVEDNFLVQSANNFPADCGVASSASSFAALTEVCCVAFSELTGKTISVEEKAMLSSKGSGSSCRSFHQGLVEWAEGRVSQVESKLNDLIHMAVIVGKSAKKVSSSEAHKRVSSSSLFLGRIERSEKRLENLKRDISPLNWKSLYENIWSEFWDMHALFETCPEPFGYFLPETVTMLNSSREFWSQNSDGPLVTMDAGPNIHLLWREDQGELALDFFNKYVKNKFICLSNHLEIGFARV